jgi:hypothetical protein
LDEFPKKKINAAEFLTAIRDRSGLFTGYGVNEYGFQHLSFQEFLAAGEIRRRESYAELVRVYGEAWWREVTRLLMGLEDPSSFAPFMRLLVASERFVQHPELTAACIHDAFEPSAQPFVAALEGIFTSRRVKADLHLLQYQLLLALRELPAEKTRAAQPLLTRVAAHGLTAEARALATELLTRLGVRADIAADAATGLPVLRINPVDEAELVLIPAGEFKCGDRREEDNRPREMTVPAFYLARYPVTNAQYAEFLKKNPKTSKPHYWDDERFNQPQQPVVGVSWAEAGRTASGRGCACPRSGNGRKRRAGRTADRIHGGTTSRTSGRRTTT